MAPEFCSQTLLMVHDLESGWSLNTYPHPLTPLCAHTRAYTHVHTSDDGEDTSKTVLWAMLTIIFCKKKIITKGEGNQNFPLLLIPAAAAAAKSLQSCPTLCDPRDGSPPGSPVPGILQARTLEWVAIFFSNAWKWKVKVKSLSCVRLLVTPWTAAYQASLSMGFSRQEYWSGVPLPSPFNTLW